MITKPKTVQNYFSSHKKVHQNVPSLGYPEVKSWHDALLRHSGNLHNEGVQLLNLKSKGPGVWLAMMLWTP